MYLKNICSRYLGGLDRRSSVPEADSMTIKFRFLRLFGGQRFFGGTVTSIFLFYFAKQFKVNLRSQIFFASFQMGFESGSSVPEVETYEQNLLKTQSDVKLQK
jgi:hypothetical protein